MFPLQCFHAIVTGEQRQERRDNGAVAVFHIGLSARSGQATFPPPERPTHNPRWKTSSMTRSMRPWIGLTRFPLTLHSCSLSSCDSLQKKVTQWSVRKFRRSKTNTAGSGSTPPSGWNFDRKSYDAEPIRRRLASNLGSFPGCLLASLLGSFLGTFLGSFPARKWNVFHPWHNL